MPTKKIGSRREVWNGTAEKTSGGLHKHQLMKKKGRIISKRKHALGKRNYHFLKEKGYTTRKGQFGVFKDGKCLVTRKSRKSA